MNAIKLPIKAYEGADAQWFVRDADNIRLCQAITGEQAHQISLALNCHDALVEALKNCRKSMVVLAALAGYDRNSGVPFAAHDKQALAALANVEENQATLTKPSKVLGRLDS